MNSYIFLGRYWIFDLGGHGSLFYDNLVINKPGGSCIGCTCKYLIFVLFNLSSIPSCDFGLKGLVHSDLDMEMRFSTIPVVFQDRLFVLFLTLQLFIYFILLIERKGDSPVGSVSQCSPNEMAMHNNHYYLV